jgi:2-methylcitrate dehydratase PrpD
MCKTIASNSTLSKSDIEQIQNLLLDFFAAMFAGYKQNKQFADSVEAVVLAQGGIAESTVLFKDCKVPARSAAFLNSLYGHGAELDDGNKKAMGHVGVHIIPAVLSLAEAEKKTMDEAMLAIACGYEAYIRISSAAQPGMVNRSFHSTGFAGAPACAVACAKLLGLNAEGIESAMSLACTMASGLITYSESQQMIKPINPAKAAETGVFAARLAQTGIKGPANCLEGPHGWFKAATEMADESIITEQFEHLLIHECYFKLFPSCRHTHCGIEAAINIYNTITDKRKTIESVDVFIYPNAIKLAGQIKHPIDADETKFSIHYTLACALLFGEYGVDYMNPPCNDDKLYDLIEKIHLIPDEKMEIREKGIRGTRIEVTLSNGEIFSNTVLVPKGDPENPLSRKDIILKLRTCSSGIITEAHLEKLIDYLSGFGGDKYITPSILFGKG